MLGGAEAMLTEVDGVRERSSLTTGVGRTPLSFMTLGSTGLPGVRGYEAGVREHHTRFGSSSELIVAGVRVTSPTRDSPYFFLGFSINRDRASPSLPSGFAAASYTSFIASVRSRPLRPSPRSRAHSRSTKASATDR